MTKTDLIAQVAANTEMSKKSAEMAVNAAFEALGKAMAEGFQEHRVQAGQVSEGHPVREAPPPPEPLGPAVFL